MYIGRGNDAISNVEKLDNITFNGGTTYALTKSSAAFTPSSSNAILISIDGVVQQGNFSVSTTNIVFDWSPTSSNTCDWVMHFGVGVLNTPADDTVSTAKIADGAVTAAKIADGTVVAAEIADNAITTAKINADAVTGAKIADDQIDSEHYVAGSIDLEHMSSESVDEDNLHISNAGSNNQFLQKQSGNTGGLTWATPSGFDVTSITGATALGATPADTDEFVLSDAGTLKRVDYSHIKGGTNELDFFIKNVSQTFTENTDTKVDFSNEQWDTGSAFNTTDKRFVCPVGKAGKYWFAFSMLLTDNCADGKTQYCRLRVNNSTYYWFEGKVSTSFTNDNPSMTCSGIVNLAESDYVEVFLRHNNGSSIIWAQDYGAFWGFRLVQ